jgi:hypothetical protein
MARILAIVPLDAESALILVDEPAACGTCMTARTIFVNRLGNTQCCFCDRAQQRLAVAGSGAGAQTKSSGVEGQRFDSADPESGSGEGTSSPSAPGAKGATA